MRRFAARDESGQAITVIALVMLALLMFSGLAVDAGQLFSARRTMQEAADSGAYAGAVVIYQRGRTSDELHCGEATDTSKDAYLAAVADATRNGFTNGVAGNSVTVNTPPLSGPYCGNRNYVEVIIQANVQTALVPAESGLTTVRVRAVAGAEPLNNGYAIMTLDRGATAGALSTGPNADIHLTGGGVLVNSTNPTAAVNQQTSNTRFTIVSPYGVDISGGTTSLWPQCGLSPCFPVAQGRPQVPDPFAGFPKPPTTGLPLCSNLNSPGCQDGFGRQNPGIYTTSLGGAAGTTLTLNPGVYILEAGINVAGLADIVSRNDLSCQGPPNTCGVFLFNTKTNYPNSGAIDTCGSITFTGNGSTDVHALTQGPYKNFLVYQDPICTAQLTISGNGTFTGSGSIYLPTAGFRFDGNNATLTGSQLIANTVDIQNGNITVDFSSSTTAQPILPRLSE